MPKRLRVLLALFFFVISFIFSSLSFQNETKVEAASFSVGYDITFTFDKNGVANVTQKISLKNLTGDLFPSEYSLNIGSSNVKNVKGEDSLGSVSVSSKKNKGTTILTAKINEKIIGKNKTTNLTLTYSISNLAKQNGRIWEILVPGISTGEKLSSFSLKIKVPKSFGPLYSMAPAEDRKSAGSKYITYSFEKKRSPAETILANFGDYQNIEFSFKYNLENTNFFSKDEKILIPRDSVYQEVNFLEISPRPKEIEIDVDGNYLAVYTLTAGEKKEILVSGSVRVDQKFNKPDNSHFDSTASTQGERFWESDDASVVQKASELKNIDEIYDFVVSNLFFDDKSIDKNINARLGAVAALANPENVLTSEFVDLFIALARAKGIPARQIIGFAIGDGTNSTPKVVNGELGSKRLHSWAEYFNQEKNKWVQVDPVWGSIREADYLNQADPNRIALFVRNSSSDSPKIPEIFAVGRDEKQAKFGVTKSDFNFTTEPKIDLDISETISGFPTVGKVIIKNDTGKSLLGAKLEVNSNFVSVIGDKVQDIGTILPYSEYTLNIKLRSNSLLDSNTDNISVVLTGFDQGKERKFNAEKEILVKPFFSLNTPQLLLLFLLFVILSGLAYPLYKRFKLD